MHHADRLNVVVSGASIIAKVIRDSEISKIRLKYGDVGSGYPSDKKTIKFVQEWFEQNREIPPFARKSWKPAQLILSRYRYAVTPTQDKKLLLPLHDPCQREQDLYFALS